MSLWVAGAAEHDSEGCGGGWRRPKRRRIVLGRKKANPVKVVSWRATLGDSALESSEDFLEPVARPRGGGGLSAGTRILVRRRPIPAVAVALARGGKGLGVRTKEDILGDSC